MVMLHGGNSVALAWVVMVLELVLVLVITFYY